MFNPINKEEIVPQYPCGARGYVVNVITHGVNWAVWKLVDDLDRHIGAPRTPSGKPKCAVCYKKLFTEYAESDEAYQAYVKDMTDAIIKAAADAKKVIDKVTVAIKAASETFNEMAKQMYLSLEEQFSLAPGLDSAAEEQLQGNYEHIAAGGN